MTNVQEARDELADRELWKELPEPSSSHDQLIRRARTNLAVIDNLTDTNRFERSQLKERLDALSSIFDELSARDQDANNVEYNRGHDDGRTSAFVDVMTTVLDTMKAIDS